MTSQRVCTNYLLSIIISHGPIWQNIVLSVKLQWPTTTGMLSLSNCLLFLCMPGVTQHVTVSDGVDKVSTKDTKLTYGFWAYNLVLTLFSTMITVFTIQSNLNSWHLPYLSLTYRYQQGI